MASRVILFIQGAGEGAHAADRLLAESLQQQVGPGYDVRFPAMPDEGDASYDVWKIEIEKEIDAASSSILLVGHSVGASHLAKCLTETDVQKAVDGIFLVSTPFWGGAGWRYEGYSRLVLPRDTSSRLPRGAKVFLYHARDDEIVPFDHLRLYATLLPDATIRKFDAGGHQLGNDLSRVAEDIAALSRAP